MPCVAAKTRARSRSRDATATTSMSARVRAGSISALGVIRAVPSTPTRTGSMRETLATTRVAGVVFGADSRDQARVRLGERDHEGGDDPGPDRDIEGNESLPPGEHVRETYGLARELTPGSVGLEERLVGL